jgi:hypothetical protein
MKGLSFSEPMVKAWLAGNKTVTRRIMNPQPADIIIPKLCITPKPRYLPGEIVYIKETWARIWNQDGCINEDVDQCPIDCEGCHIEYKADTGARHPAEWPDESTGDPSCPKWKSPRFMPETASRSHALIKSVIPERIREINEVDAYLEGFRDQLRGETFWSVGAQFKEIWDKLHPESWERNDWVWRIELERRPL